MSGEAEASTSGCREVSPAKHAGPSIQVPPGMSKNAAKKLARKQKLEETKHERRAAERLKKKQNKRARFLVAQSTATDSTKRPRSSTEDDVESHGWSKKSRAAAGDKEASPKGYFDARLVIDCGFDELMAEKETISMTQQLMYLYSANRNAKVPFGEIILTGQDRPRDCLKDVHPDHLSLVPAAAAATSGTSTDDISSNAASMENSRIGRAMDGKLRGVWRRWKRVTIYKSGSIESLLSTTGAESSASTSRTESIINDRHFAPEEARQALRRIPLSSAVYLTADTDDTLTELEPGVTYIIGGIVDKNRYKGLCRAKADRLGIRAAKLPLSQDMLEAVERNVRSQGESIQDVSAGEGDTGFVGRKVLTVNQVVEILTAWTETRDWVKALEKALPRRKLKQRGPVAKVKDTAEASTSGQEEQDEDAARNEHVTN